MMYDRIIVQDGCEQQQKLMCVTSSGMGSTFGEKKLFLPPGGISAAVRSFTNPGICCKIHEYDYYWGYPGLYLSHSLGFILFLSDIATYGIRPEKF